MHIGRTSSIAPDFTRAKLAAARLFAYIDKQPKIDASAKYGSLLASNRFLTWISFLFSCTVCKNKMYRLKSVCW